MTALMKAQKVITLAHINTTMPVSELRRDAPRSSGSPPPPP